MNSFKRAALVFALGTLVIGAFLVASIGHVIAAPEVATETPFLVSAAPDGKESTGGQPEGTDVSSSAAYSSGYKPMLASASLPAVEHVLAVVKAAPSPRWSLKSPSPKAAPVEAEAVLTTARDALSMGRAAEAAGLLISVHDNFRGTSAVSDANRLLMDKGEAMAREKADPQSFEDFEAGFPKWESIGAAGKYALMDYYKEVFYVAQQEGNEPLAAPYRQKALEHSRRLIFEHPNDPLQNSAVGSYYDYGVEEGGEALREMVADLEVLAAQPQPAMSRLAARYNLAAYAQNFTNERGAYILRMSEVVEDFDAGFVDSVFSDPDVIYWVKSWLLLNLGQALRAVGRYEDALDLYTQHEPWILGRAGGGIRLEMADLVKILNPQDAFAQVDAYEGIVASMDKKGGYQAEYRARALHKLGAVYLNYGDYRGAAQILEQLVLEHPEDKIVPSVQQDLDFIYNNLHDSVEVYNFAPADKMVYAQVCGPKALQRWLASRGSEVPMEQLALEARNDLNGASMFGLMEAAKLHGLTTLGVAAESIDQLPRPFLAHVNEDHFLLVLDRVGDSLVVSDNGADPEPMAVDAFSARWNGKALIEEQDSESLAALTVLDLDTLKGARGGTGSSNDNNAPPPPPPGPKTKPYSSFPNWGQGDLIRAHNPWDGDTRHVPLTEMPGAPDSATGGIAHSGVFVPGGFLSVIPSGATVQLSASDLRVPVRGDLQLAFTRHYICKAGFETTAYTNTSKPWGNNIGAGWTHNLNVHITTSTPTGYGYPLTVIFYDETGEARTFARDAGASTASEDLYYRSLAVYPEEKRQVLVRDKSSGTYVLWRADNGRYEFSAPTASTDRYARLQAIVDAHGNAITLEYDGAVGTGKLTKALAPTGDPRYLEFTYTGSLISQVTLMKESTALAAYTYTHDGNNELAEVEDPGQNSVTYTYATHGSVPASRFLSQITDKNDVATDLTWGFSYASGLGYLANQITIESEDGRRTVYQRSLSTYIASVTTYNDTTPESKYIYTPVGATGMPWHVDYYQDGTSPYFERWMYLYGTDGYSLEQIVGPGSVVLADYTLDAYGRPTTTTDVTGQGASFSYSSPDDALPNSITRRDGTTVTLAFDTNGRVENALETEVINGVTYTYDSYGHISSITDPLGNDTTYLYDAMGNLVEEKSPHGDVVTRIYDDFGNTILEYDSRGALTQYEYDTSNCQSCPGSMGLLVKKTDALWNVTAYEYDVHGNLTTITYPDESQRSFTYDIHGQRTSENGTEGTTLFEYDILGRLEREEKPSGRSVEYTYDHMGRALTREDGAVETPYTYDSYGNILTTSTSTGNDKTNTYDANMRLSDTTDEFGTKSYTYDNAKDRLTSITDEELHTTTYTYTTGNRLSSESSDSGRQKHFTYDDYGRQIAVGTGATGQGDPIQHAYDYAGRLESTSYTNGSVVSTTGMKYDEKGRTTQITDWVDSTSGLHYRYDILGRVDQIRDHYGATLDYFYDEMNRVVRFNDYFGNDVVYEYDPVHGEVSRIVAPGGNVWTFVHNAEGELERYTAPNDMTTTYTRDGTGRVKEIRLASGVAIVERFSYTYNAAGFVTSEIGIDSAGWTYLYDDRGRLTVATRHGAGGTLAATYTYTYDASDNLTSRAVGGIDGQLDTQMFTYYDDNLIATLTSNGGAEITYAYDDWGRPVSKTDGTHAAMYMYTEGLEPTSVTTDFPGAVDVAYSHRGDAKRRRLDVPNEISFFHWSLGDAPVNAEVLPNATALKSSGSATERKLFVPLNPLSDSTSVLAELDAFNPASGDSSFYSHDLMGSVRRSYDKTAARTSSLEYAPFGTVISESGRSPLIGYQGSLYDSASGEQYRAPVTEFMQAAHEFTARGPEGDLRGDHYNEERTRIDQMRARQRRVRACERAWKDCADCRYWFWNHEPQCDDYWGCEQQSCRTGQNEFFTEQETVLCISEYSRCLSEAYWDVLDQVTPDIFIPYFTIRQEERVSESPELYRITAYDWTYTDGNEVSYTWLLNGVESDQTTHRPEFALAPGTYAIKMQLSVSLPNRDPEVIELTRYIDVLAQPIADFEITSDTHTVSLPIQVQFENTSTGTDSIETYHWNFGDGLTQEYAGPTPLNTSHWYYRAGTYTVTLTVTNANGSHSKSRELTLIVDPIPFFDWEQSGYGGDIYFRDRTTRGTLPIQVRQWDFDGDGIFENSTFASNRYVTQNFATPDQDYTVTMRTGTLAEASAGTLHEYSADVKFNEHVIVDFEALLEPETSAGKIPVLFTDASVINQSDPITIESWNWTFGDGTTAPGGTLGAIRHDYDDPGRYDVTLDIWDGASTHSVTKKVQVSANQFYREYGVSDDFQTYDIGAFTGSDWYVEYSGQTQRDGISIEEDSEGNRYLTVNSETPPNSTDAAIIQRSQHAQNNRLTAAIQFFVDPETDDPIVLDNNVCAAFRTRADSVTIYNVVEIYPNKVIMRERWGNWGTGEVEIVEFPLLEPLEMGAWYNVYIETYGHSRQVWIRGEGQAGGTKGLYDWDAATQGPPIAWRSQDKLAEMDPPVTPLDSTDFLSIHILYLGADGNYYPNAVRIDDLGLGARTGDFVIPFTDDVLESRVRETLGIPSGEIYGADLVLAPPSLNWVYDTGAQIGSLRGLEYFRNTTELVLDGHQVAHVFPSTQPPAITRVSLKDNALEFVGPAWDWDELRHLDLSGNPLSAMGALDGAAELSNLEELILYNTGLYDLLFDDMETQGHNVTRGVALNGLRVLESLRWVDVRCTQVRNLYPLVNNPGLQQGGVVTISPALIDPENSTAVQELESRNILVDVDDSACANFEVRFRLESSVHAAGGGELPPGHGCALDVSSDPAPQSCGTPGAAYECIIAGTEVTVTPQPGAGYLLHELRVNGSAVDLENGSYIFPMDGDKSIVAEFIGESVLTIEFPTAGYTPEVYVDNGFIIGDSGTARTISVATGETVSLTIPDGALINFDEGILFSHWADTEDPVRAFDGSRDPALDLTVADSTTIQLVGSADYRWLELRDHYTYPGPGQEPVLRGSAVVAADPSDRLLPVSFPDINGVSTRYYVLSEPGVPTPVTLTPAAEADYAFEGWEYTGETSGAATSTANPLELDMTENWTVEPIFETDPHVLTVNINPAGGGSVAFEPDPINGDETAGQRVEYFNPFREDKTVTLRAVEDLESDQRFDHWEGGTIHGQTNPEVSFELTEDTAVTAVFIPSFALSVRNLGGGAVTLTPPARTIDGPVGYEFYPDPAYSQLPAEVVTVAAVEDPFLHLDHWIIDGVGLYSDQPQTVTMSEAHDVVAVFLPGGTHFRFAAHVVGEGTVHLAHSAGHEGQDRDLVEADGLFEEHLPPGATVTATQTPASGWVFDHWQVHEPGSVDVAQDPLPAINSETSLVAVFRKDVSDPDKVTLTLTQSGEGTVIPAPGVTRYDKDAKVIFTAEPAVGWRFDGWSGSFTSSSPSNTVDKMTSSMAVHATFVPDGTWYSLDVYASEGGTVSPTFGDYASGATVTVTATPEDGWVFDHWEGDDADGSMNDVVQVTMNGNKQLKANFTPLVLISIPPPGTMPGGTFEISPYKPEGYRLGESVTFTPVPDPAWEFDHWEGDLRTSGLKSFGVHSGLMTKSTQSSEGTVTTTLSTSPFQVWAVFKREEYLLTTRAIGDGTIRTSPSKNHFRFGERVKLVALPGADMQFSGWKSSVTQSSAGAIIEFDMPFEDVVVEAVFRRSGRTHKITSLGWMTDDLGSLVIVDANVVTMSPSPGPTYPTGSRVLVTAHNIPGHEFVRWSGDISGSDQTYTIHQLTSDLTIVPVYTPIRELDQLSSITVTTIKGRESSPGLGTPVADPPPIRVDSSDCWDWEDLHPYEEPPAGFCNDGNPRYCTWKLYYTSPMPDVNISVSGAVSIVAAYGEENHGLVVGSDSVNVLAPQVDCGSYPLTRRAGLTAFDIEATEGHVDLELFDCLYAVWDAYPYPQTNIGGCGFEGTCLGWEAGSFLGESRGLFSSNNLTIQGGGRLIGRENWVLESGTHVLLGSPSLTSTYLNGGLIADYGWEITNYSETPTDAGVDTVYTLEESGTGTTVVVNSSAGGSATGSDVYYPHESATLTATPLPGYSFKYWKRRISGSGEYSPFSTSNPLILPACLIRSQSWQNHFFAEFETRCNSQYSVTIDAIDNGTISLTENRLYYDCDESVEFRAIPDLGYTFVGWTGDLEGTTTNPVTLPTNQNRNVGAIFQPLEDPGFVVALDVDGDGIPEANPEEIVQLVNVPEAALAQFPQGHFDQFARRIGFEITGGLGTEHNIQEASWEITIEQDTTPELHFFATNAWTRQDLSGASAYPEYEPGIGQVYTSSFDLRDLDGLGLYAVAFRIPDVYLPHNVVATFHLSKNGVPRSSREIEFQVGHGAWDGIVFGPDGEDAPANSSDGMHGPGDEIGGLSPNGAVGDPVYQFSGEFTEEMTDLRVKSPGLDFEWSRIYRSKHARNNTAFGVFTGPSEIVQQQIQEFKAAPNPVGEQWDFSYNIWLKRQNDGKKILVHDGRSGREEVWERGEDSSQPWTNGDYPTQITMQDPVAMTGKVEMTYADKTVYEFWPLEESYGGKRGRLRYITDRFGNQMKLYYEELEGGQARLNKVLDTAGRAYHLYYNGDGALKRIRDFTGRSVYYTYDSEGRLDRVRDSRGWTVNRYAYHGDTDLLTQIWDGNGANYLTNEYDMASTDFMKHRVTRQVYGEGVFNFSYELLGDPDELWRVTVNDPEGNITVTTFDDKNRTRSERVYAARLYEADGVTVRVDDQIAFSELPTDPSSYFETTHEYQGDTSLVTRIDYPLGNYETFTYGGAADEPVGERDWWTVGNMRTATYHPAGAGNPIVQEWDFADDYGNHGNHSRFVKRYKDGREFETTVANFDRGNPLDRTYAISGIQESFLYNGRGQLTLHTHPEDENNDTRKDKYVYDPDDVYLVEKIIDFGGLDLTTTYDPNERGLVTEVEDPKGYKTKRRYNHRDLLMLEEAPEVANAGNRARQTLFDYDGNNNLTWTSTDNFDETGADYGTYEALTRVIDYTTLNSPVSVIEDVGKLDASIGEMVVHSVETTIDYDRNENPLVQWSGEAASGNQPLNKTTFVYNTRQRVEKKYHGDPATQNDTVTVEYTYDANGNVTEVLEDPSGAEESRVTYRQYDGFNRLQYVTDPMGNVTEYVYDANGNLENTLLWGEVEDSSAVPASGSETDLTAHRGGLTRMAETENDYDALNRKTLTTVRHFNPIDQSNYLADDASSEIVYNKNSTVERVINANGHATQYEYDTAYRLTETADAKGNRVTLALDANGNVERTTETAKSDLGGADAVYYLDVLYDELNRPYQSTNNAGHVTETKYDSRGNAVYAKDGEGNETELIYDGLGRLLRTTRLVPETGEDDVVTVQTWDDNSRLDTQTDPNGNVTDYVYDSHDRLDKIVFADATEVDYTYDSFGNEKSKLDANGTAVASVYDALDRLTGKTITPDDPQGPIQGATFESYGYDSLSNTTEAANDYATVTREFDSMSNLRKETVEYASDGFTEFITHDYDRMGNPLETTYPGGRTVTHAYDDLERIATIHSSQGGNGSNLLAAYDYLGAGRVERRTLAGNGTRLDYGFDAIGRVNATTHAVTATSAVFDERSYAWDKASNKTQRVELVASVPVKTYDYQYDALNRLKRSIKTVGAAAAGTAGNWTGAMALDTVTPAIADFMGGTPLQLDGNFDVQFNTGSLGVYVTKVQGTRDEAVDYPADLQGYTTAQIDARAPARPEQGTFDIYASALDGANRVYSDPKSITYGPHIIEYDLDGAGNRKELATQAETAPDTYTDLATVAYTEDGTTPAPADAQMNQYTTVPEEASARLYDENGNLLQTGASSPAVFRHDYLDRIHDLDDGSVVATYFYDALGRRIEKTIDGGSSPVTTRYLYDGVRVAEEWDVPDMGAPALSASYVYGNYIDEVLTMRRGSADYYYHADDQFNVVKLTDNTGAVVEAYDYGDYGQPEFYDAAGAIIPGTAYANPYLFTGRRWDEELGYYYFRNRYMDPVHGRFASRDPLGLWGDGANLGNGYTYAASNPWSLVDPMGLCGGNQGLFGWLKDAFGFGGEEPPIRPIEGETDYNTYAFVLVPESNSALEIFRDAIEQGKDEAAEGALEIGDRALKEVAPDLVPIPGVGALVKIGKNAKNAAKGGTKESLNMAQRLVRYGKRLAYIGKTPGKNSDTGRKVIEKMRGIDKVRTNIRGETIFQASDGKWYDIKYADMAHREAAVIYWNREGYQYGARSDEVRKWMTNADNYFLEHRSINRSEGARLGVTYRSPL